jgi:hypothetical protein
LLAGWRKSYELTLQHMMTVKGYRENLAAAWPPEKSPASAAYIQRLDELIANLQQTYDAAVANHSAFSSATLALSSARRDLDKVVTEYVSNEGKLAAFEEEQAAVQPKGALARPPEAKPPVAAARQEQLMVQARRIMHGLSSELTQARAQITNPPIYNPVDNRNKNDAVYGGTPLTPSTIPLIFPFSPEDVRSSALDAAGPTHQIGYSGSSQPQPSAQAPGLVLGGADVHASAGKVVSPSTGVANPAVSGSSGHLLLPVTATPSAIGNAQAVRSPKRLADGYGGVGISPPPHGTGRMLPPIGVIGGPPGTGLTQPVPTPRVPRPNPMGSVIGSTETSGRSGAGLAHGIAGQAFGAMPGRAPDEGKEDPNVAVWDPDNPWTTAQGVAPVVLPAQEQHFDPGPAIGFK